MDERKKSSHWAPAAFFALISSLALAAFYLPQEKPSAPEPQVASSLPSLGPVAELWVSTQDRRLRLAPQPDIEIAADDGSPADVVVDTNKTYQTIVGFGAAMTDSSAWLIQNKLSALQRYALVHELFGPSPGLNLNMMRLTIGASDFSLRQYTLDDLPTGQVDPGLKYFNIAADQHDLIPAVREALAVNPQLQIIASPWSAPAWMKTSDNLIGGTLLEPDESDYAQYLVKYVDALRSNGIPLFALTVQNEPGFEPATYPGMTLSPEQRARIIAKYLGPTLASRKPRTRILGLDHNWDDPDQPLSLLADPDVKPYIDGIAWHCYRGSPSAQTQVHQAYPKKDAYITECSGGDWESSKNGELLWFARDLLLGGLRNWARGVVYWNLALDENHGPHFGGCATCKGMVTINSKTGAVSRNDYYYAFGQFSRFVLPGAVRVSSSSRIKGLANVAFQNVDGGSIVLVLVNSKTDPQQVSVSQGGNRFQYTLPPQSVATFVWGVKDTESVWRRWLLDIFSRVPPTTSTEKAAEAAE